MLWRDRSITWRCFLVYVGVTFFSVLVTVLYYAFDHGLRDGHMTLLFLPPLIMAILQLVLAGSLLPVDRKAMYSINIAFAFFWFYMLLSGIYTMAKVVSDWLWVYLLLSGIALLVAMLPF